MNRQLSQVQSQVRALEASVQSLRLAAARDRSWVQPRRPELFSFELLADMGVVEAAADIYRLDGSQIPSPESPDPPLQVQNSLGQFAHLETGDTGLCYWWEGKYYAVHPDVPGDVSGETLLATFVLTANLASGVGETATATVGVTTDGTLSPGDPITVVSTGNHRSYSGLSGLAIKTGGAWWIVEVDQHCLQFVGTLAVHTHSLSLSGGNVPGKVSSQQTIKLSAGEAMTPYPFAYLPSISFDVETSDYVGPAISNPYNWIAKSGDKVLIVHERSTDTNEILCVFPATARAIRGTFAEAAPNGLTPTIEVAAEQASPFGGGVGELPATVDAVDKFYLGHNAQANDACHIVYNFAADNWEIIASQHTATECLALVAANFSAAPATFTVDNVVGLNGVSPSASTLTVQNRYGWESGLDGYQIEIRWDPINGQWFPRQMKSECE